MKKITLSTILASLFAIPFVSAYSGHTVASDLSHFVNAFRVLFNGDVGGFTHHLVQSLPVLGVVVIIFGLVYFVAKLTIFRENTHVNDTDKYAKALAIGISLIGLAQQSVYNVILNWGRLFLIFIFIIAIIAMSSLFYTHWRTRHFEDDKKRLEAKKAHLPLKNETEKLKHDLKMQKKTYGKVDSDLSYLKSELNDLDKLSGNELRQVEKLISLLSRASSAKKLGSDEGDTKQYASVLSSGIHKLISTMNHEPSHIRHIESTLHDVETKLSSWGRSVEGDINEVTTDEKLLEKYLKHKKGHSSIINLSDIKDEDIMKKHFKELRSYLHELQKIERRIEHEKKRLVNHSLHDKFDSAEAARSAIHTTDYDSAERNLKHLHSLIQSEDILIKTLRDEDMAMQSTLSSINHVERKINKIDFHELKNQTS